MIKLYHYSNTDFKGYVKVSYYGQNYFTSNDKNITMIKRAFFYLEPRPEHLLRGSQYLYIAEIEPRQLYSISQDIKGYLQTQSIGEALRQIKRQYKGVIYNIGNYNIVNLFYDIKIIDKIKLDKY